MLDQVCRDYPDRVALIVWHAATSFPLYRQEAWDKWHLYPPPLNGGYYYPWLWADGKSCNWIPYYWRDSIVRHMAETSDVRLSHVGTNYNPSTRSGDVWVECFNNSSSPITAALQIAITEDSLYYPSSNGDTWHNRVFRDYVPNINGTPVTVPAGGADTAFQHFTIDPSYVEARCRIVVYLQDMTVHPDSTMPIYQGLQTNLLDFTGVEEPQEHPAAFAVRAGPNPCRSGCAFTVAGGREVEITIHAPDGRQAGVLQTHDGRAVWNRPLGLASGIYLYRARAGTATCVGKLVVTD